MSRLNYKHLRYFHAVAKDGNLTRAAEALGVSQSALSIQIRDLETSLGQALFERTGKRLIPTEAGKIALSYADAIFQSGDELLMRLNARTGKSKQVVRIGAQATLSRNFQAQFLKPVATRNDLDIILKSGAEAELLNALASLDLDIVLANIAPPRDQARAFIVHTLARQSVSLIGPPAWRGRFETMEGFLMNAPLIVPGQSSSVRTELDALFDRLDIQANIVAEIDDMAMMRVLCREGFGLAVAPPIVVKDELLSGQLHELVQLDDIRETFYAIVAPRKFPNPIISELIGPLETSVQDVAPSGATSL